MTAATWGTRIVDAVASAFGAPAMLELATGGGGPVRCILRRGTEPQPFGQTRPIRAGATARVPFADAPTLRDGDVLVQEGRRWRIQGQPTRPDDGRWWVADVADKGEA